MMRLQVRPLIVTAMFATIALLLSYVETIMPIFLIPIPGFKIGLSNIVVAALITISPIMSFNILLLKVTVTALLFGSPISLLFSACGGLCSYFAMYLIARFMGERVSHIGINAVGAFSHSVGQLLVTAAIYGVNVALSYSSPMMFSSVVCGVALGLILNFFYVRLKNILEKNY